MAGIEVPRSDQPQRGGGQWLHARSDHLSLQLGFRPPFANPIQSVSVEASAFCDETTPRHTGVTSSTATGPGVAHLGEGAVGECRMKQLVYFRDLVESGGDAPSSQA